MMQRYETSSTEAVLTSFEALVRFNWLPKNSIFLSGLKSLPSDIGAASSRTASFYHQLGAVWGVRLACATLNHWGKHMARLGPPN